VRGCLRVELGPRRALDPQSFCSDWLATRGAPCLVEARSFQIAMHRQGQGLTSHRAPRFDEVDSHVDAIAQGTIFDLSVSLLPMFACAWATCG
jgi:hypothetical protein